MCIVLLTTAHPSYALIVLDNRDEFILRPTSRPHWWSSNTQHILSSRDLQREEQGTWLGVTKTGNFAVLTNFRETNTNDAHQPVQGERSRGGMVTAWLTSPRDETTIDFVHRLLGGEGLKGVGGFSLICGKLRKRLEESRREIDPLAIISNRCEASQDVPWIANSRDEVYGLSNTSYNDPVAWPKVESGKKLLFEVVQEAVASGWKEDQLVQSLFDVLDTDTLPSNDGHSFEEYIIHLKESIFIPPIGNKEVSNTAPKADAIAAAGEATLSSKSNGHVKQNSTLNDLKQRKIPDTETNNCMTGCYGTQRQTIVLVDWEGNLTFRERALWDAQGKYIPHGEGDVKLEFKIEGWNEQVKGNSIISQIS